MLHFISSDYVSIGLFFFFYFQCVLLERLHCICANISTLLLLDQHKFCVRIIFFLHLLLLYCICKAFISFSTLLRNTLICVICIHWLIDVSQTIRPLQTFSGLAISVLIKLAYGSLMNPSRCTFVFISG